MSWSAGERADAHQIAGVLREKFDRPEKNAARELVARWFAHHGATSIVDLGGWGSAEVLRKHNPSATLTVAENGSVCDADWFTDRLGHRVSRDRLRRALEVRAEEVAYTPHWGDVRGLSAQAVWLDLCSQWTSGLGDILEEMAETELMAITLLPERDGLGTIGHLDRATVLATLATLHTGMCLSYAGLYKRNDLGQEMCLLLLRHRSGGRSVIGFHPRKVAHHIARYGHWASSEMGDSGLVSQTKMAFRGKPSEPTCRWCKGRFHITLSTGAGRGRSSNAAYCSDGCRKLARKKYDEKRYREKASTRRLPSRPCRTCGVIVFKQARLGGETPQYCSRECRAASRRVTPIIKTCRWCSATFTGVPSRQFCQQRCRRRWDERQARARRAA